MASTTRQLAAKRGHVDPQWAGILDVRTFANQACVMLMQPSSRVTSRGGSCVSQGRLIVFGGRILGRCTDGPDSRGEIKRLALDTHARKEDNPVSSTFSAQVRPSTSLDWSAP